MQFYKLRKNKQFSRQKELMSGGTIEMAWASVPDTNQKLIRMLLRGADGNGFEVVLSPEEARSLAEYIDKKSHANEV